MKTRLTSVTYLGYTAMDRRFSTSMLPWLLKEIRATGVWDKLSIAIEDGCLKAYNGNFEPVISHRLVDIVRASQVPGSPEELFYILLNEKEALLNCYLFRASTVQEANEWTLDMLGLVWAPLARQTVAFVGLSNLEFWFGAVLILFAFEMDLIYFHILNTMDFQLL